MTNPAKQTSRPKTKKHMRTTKLKTDWLPTLNSEMNRNSYYPKQTPKEKHESPHTWQQTHITTLKHSYINNINNELPEFKHNGDWGQLPVGSREIPRIRERNTITNTSTTKTHRTQVLPCCYDWRVFVNYLILYFFYFISLLRISWHISWL